MSKSTLLANGSSIEEDTPKFVPEARPTSSTKAHLESIVLQFVEALNDRNIGTESPIWQHFDRTLFRIEAQGPAFTSIESYLDGPLFAKRERRTMDMDQFMTSRVQISDQFPHHHTRVVRIDTILSDKGRSGQIIVYAEVRGIPEGYTRPTTGMFDFMLMGTLKEGKWRIVKMQTFPGMPLSDGI